MVLLIVNWHLELPQFLAVHQYYDSLNILVDWVLSSQDSSPLQGAGDWYFDILPKYLQSSLQLPNCSLTLIFTVLRKRDRRGPMKIPFKINDDIIISNNDKGNDVSNGSEDRSQVFSPLIKYHLIHHCLALLLSELCWNNNN